MDKQKILIVDDSEMNRDLLVEILKNQYDIVEAKELPLPPYPPMASRSP